MSAVRRSVSGALCAASLLMTPARVAADDALPRYRLKVGQELTYSLKSGSSFGEGSKAEPYGSDDEWHVWVVRQNADGSWRLLLRESRSLWYGRDKKVQDGGQTLDYCDFFPDGRHVEPALFGYSPDKGLDPGRVLPRLPVDADAAARGWEGTFAADEARTRYTAEDARPAAGKPWIFTGVRETPLDKVYLLASRTKYTYDPGRGVIGKATETTSRGWEGRKNTVSIELREVKQADAAATAQLAAEVDRYFAATEVYDDLTSQAESSTDAAALYAKAEAAIRDVRGKLTLPLFRERVDAILKDHGFLAKIFVESAADRAAMLGKPSPDWETKDFQGNTRALKDYRGKVVVLDFWGRGCGWCMRSLPQVARLAEDFKGEPVAVLGMSLDSKEEDARFVIKKMGLSYPVLKAKDLRKTFCPHGVPVMIILDAKGVIRDYQCGYQPTLHAAASASIRKLLAESGATTRR
jgi:peroxiredoxin